MKTIPPFIILVSLLTCTPALQSCGSKSSDAAVETSSKSKTITVKGVVVVPQQLDNIVRSSGTVLASESVDLVTESAGRIEKISFTEGQHVAKNDLLVKINDDDLQAQLKKVEAQITLASEQGKRQKQLLDKNLISSEQYDISLTQIHSLEADKENLNASIRKREVRAPFDGIVGLRAVSDGGYVSQTTRIASIQKINPLKVDFAIPEKYAGSVAVGDPVTFTNDEARLKFTGKVYAIEPKIDPALGSLQIRALCDNKEEKIFPGSYVEIELRLKNITDALIVPTQAVVPVLKGQTILVKRNGVVVSILVKSGIRTASSVQILNGLEPGDTVITTGIMQLRPGMPVNVIVD